MRKRPPPGSPNQGLLLLASTLALGGAGILVPFAVTAGRDPWWAYATGWGFIGVAVAIFAYELSAGWRLRRWNEKARRQEKARRRVRDAAKKSKQQRLLDVRGRPDHVYLLAARGRPVRLVYPQYPLGMRVQVSRVGSTERYTQKPQSGEELPDGAGISVVFPNGFEGAEAATPGDYEAVWERDVNYLKTLEGEPPDYGEVARDRFWYLQDVSR